MNSVSTPTNAPAILWCEGESCRLRADRGEPRGRPSPARRLCLRCFLELKCEIEELPRLYEECGRMLGASLAPRQERITGGGPAGMPFNAAAAEARSGVLADLACWSGLVVDERRLAPPRRTVQSLSDFLLRHADWLAAHPAAAEVTKELMWSAAAARAVVRPGVCHRRRVGPCVVTGCEGSLTAFDGSADSRFEVRCDADPEHAWSGRKWTQLSGALRRTASATSVAAAEAGIWLTATDIARLWRTPVGTVYRLASEQRWERRRRGTKTLYRGRDVHDCFNRRERSATERE